MFTHRLRKKGFRVSVTGFQQKSPDQITFDITAPEWALLPPADVLINCIGIIREHGAVTFELAHVAFVSQLLAYRKLCGNPYLIHISALGAKRGHPSQFLDTKGQGEELIQAEAGDCAIIRPSIVCTKGTTLAVNLAILVKRFGQPFGLIPLVGNGSAQLQPIAAPDLAELVAVLVRERCPIIIDGVGPRVFDLKTLTGLALLAHGVQARMLPIPLSLLSIISKVLAIYRQDLLSPEHLLMLSQANTADPALIAAVLGHAPGDTLAFFADPANYSSQRPFDSCNPG